MLLRSVLPRRVLCQSHWQASSHLYRNRQQIVTSEDIQNYKSDTSALARWLDVSIVQRNGRCYDADRTLLDPRTADIFPTIRASTLEGRELTIPGDIEGEVKLIVFSFKHYGFTLLRSWMNPFIERFGSSSDGTSNRKASTNSKRRARKSSKLVDTSVDSSLAVGKYQPVVAFEICFVEYGFLSMAKTIFANNIKHNVHKSQYDKTALVFGGVKDFAAQLLLPNVFTGYACLVDRHNRIRWKGTGEGLEHEVEALLRCTEELLQESPGADNKKTST